MFGRFLLSCASSRIQHNNSAGGESQTHQSNDLSTEPDDPCHTKKMQVTRPWSHDKDGCHVHIRNIPLKLLFSRTSSWTDPEGGCGHGVWTPPPEKSHKYGVSLKYWSGSYGNHKATNPAFNVEPAIRHLNTSEAQD